MWFKKNIFMLFNVPVIQNNNPPLIDVSKCFQRGSLILSKLFLNRPMPAFEWYQAQSSNNRKHQSETKKWFFFIYKKIYGVQ